MIKLLMFLPLFLASVSEQQHPDNGNPYFDEKLQKVRFEETQRNAIPCPRRRSMNNNAPNTYGPSMSVPSLQWRSTYSLEEEKSKNVGIPAYTPTAHPIVPDENVEKSTYPDSSKQQFQDLLYPNMYNQQPQQQQHQQPMFQPNEKINQQVQSMFSQQHMQQQPSPMFPDILNQQQQASHQQQNNQQPPPPIFPDISNQQQQTISSEPNKQQLQSMFPEAFSQQRQSTFPEKNMQQPQSSVPDPLNLQQQSTFHDQNKQLSPSSTFPDTLNLQQMSMIPEQHSQPYSLFPDTFNSQKKSTFQEQNKQLSPPSTFPDTLNQQQLPMIPEQHSQPQTTFPQSKNQQQQSSLPEPQEQQLPTSPGVDTFYQHLPGYIFPERSTERPHLYPVKDIRTPSENQPEFTENKLPTPTIPESKMRESISSETNKQQSQIPLSETNKQQSQFPEINQEDQTLLRTGNIPEARVQPEEHEDNAYLHVNDARIGLNADEINRYLDFQKSADNSNSLDSKPSQSYMNEVMVGLRDNRPLNTHCLPEHDFEPSRDLFSRRSLEKDNYLRDHKLFKKSSNTKSNAELINNMENDQENSRYTDIEDKPHIESKENAEIVESNRSNENKRSDFKLEETANTRRQLLEPTKGLDVYRMPDTKSAIIEGSRVCYACSTVTDPTCWQPHRKTTVKYCRQGHRACVTRTYRTAPDNGPGAELIVVRDCSSSCEESFTSINQLFKYESCSVCENDLCNIQPIENGAISYNPINIAFVLVITGLISCAL